MAHFFENPYLCRSITSYSNLLSHSNSWSHCLAQLSLFNLGPIEKQQILLYLTPLTHSCNSTVFNWICNDCDNISGVKKSSPRNKLRSSPRAAAEESSAKFDKTSISGHKQPTHSSSDYHKRYKLDSPSLDCFRAYDSSDSIDLKQGLSRKYLGRKGRRKGSLHLRRELVSYQELALQRNLALASNNGEPNQNLLKNLRDGLSQYFTPGNIRKSRNSHLNTDEDLVSINSDNKLSESDSERMGKKVSITTKK